MKKTKILVAALAAALVLPSLQSCKKGAEDPGISLRSRKARVVGDWTVKSMEMATSSTTNYDDPDTQNEGDVVKREYTMNMSWDGSTYTENSTSKTTYDNNDYSSSETTISGSSYTEKTENSSGGTVTTNTKTGTATVSFSQTYSFKKDGTLEMKTSFSKTTETTDDSNSAYSLKTTRTNTEDKTQTGTWAFLGKNKADEMKNKQRIAIWYNSESGSEVTENNYDYTDKDANDFVDWNNMDNSSKTTTTPTTHSYDNTDPDEVWEIVMLKNKEMKVVRVMNTTEQGTETQETTNSNGGSTTTTSTTTNYDRVTSSTTNITLTQE